MVDLSRLGIRQLSDIYFYVYVSQTKEKEIFIYEHWFDFCSVKTRTVFHVVI